MDFEKVIEYIKEKYEKINFFYFFSIIIIMVLIRGSFYGYHQWRIYKEKELTTNFFELLERYSSLASEKNVFPLQELAGELKSFSNKYPLFSLNKYSLLLNFFLTVKSDQLYSIDEKVIEILKNFNYDNEIDQIYLLITALILIRSNGIYSSKGEEIITLLINKKTDTISPCAIFLYGWYTLLYEGRIKADKIWNQLFVHPRLRHSPYYELAKKARNWEL